MKRERLACSARAKLNSIAKWLPLFGITYDAKDNLLEIVMEGVDHLIRSPRSISVDEGPDGLRGMEIIDGERRRQIVTLRDPVLLPPFELRATAVRK